MVLLLVELAAGVDDGWLVRRVTIHELDDIGQRLHAVHFQLVDDGSFADILLRHDETFEFLLASTDGNGQGATDGLQTSVES